jgi:hypothetical protein
MKRVLSVLLPVALAAAVACQNSEPTSSSNAATLASAFASLPLGFSNVQPPPSTSTGRPVSSGRRASLHPRAPR